MAPQSFRIKAVLCLHCKHCMRTLCVRAMKAILLADAKVELYSTDSKPCNVQLVLQPYRAKSCRCYICDFGCLSCGTTIGYNVVKPCSSCLDSCNNGHMWMFFKDSIFCSLRRDSKLVIINWGQLCVPEQDTETTLITCR